jgi:arsenate reductase
MIRDSEPEYERLGLSDDALSNAQLYEALAAHPILLQRPIVVRNGRAVIGRPPENVAKLFDQDGGEPNEPHRLRTART